MRADAGFDAKLPTQPFEADSEAKRDVAGAALRAAAAQWLDPLHERLRAAQNQRGTLSR